jgi:hypothetical protein
MRIGNIGLTILSTIATNGPMSQTAAMADIRRQKAPCAKNWGHSYFAPNRRGHGHEASLILRGLIHQVGKQGNNKVYDLTEAGRHFIGA